MKKIVSLFVISAALILGGCAGKEAPSPEEGKAKTSVPDEVYAQAESHYKMGIAYLNTLADHNAYRELKKAVELVPDDDRYLYALGLFFLKRGRYGEAEVYVRKALDHNPGESEYLNALATALASRGQLDEALKKWDRVINDPGYPYQIVALTNAANALYNAERYDEVPEYLNKALRINRRYANAYELLFKSYAMDSNYDKAAETLEKAVEMIPESLEFKMRLGEFYFERGKYAKAVPVLKEVIKEAPTSEEADRAEELMRKLGLINE
ncbi:tetratricopeptide repeat protein [Limisalsivibrio acetivorans]|uniref:tetratricopeptide repeat protein n=1 Tax=Limisalsivibrio acetivorans TaxID=1304888 RepID=UPI0003B78769|nr:tetratricopeptide repeat protein [Limisalsivibrio acetivorans]